MSNKLNQNKWEQQLDFYDKLVAKCPKFERKGKTVPHTAANGYMFSLLNKEAELGIRLPIESAEQFMEKYNTTRYKSHGSFMKDYVLIPESMYSKNKLLIGLLNESFEFMMSLPAKKGKK